MCAGVAHLVRRPRLARITALRLQLRVRSRRPVRQVGAPDDHVMPLAGDDVIGAVPLLPEVYDAAADRVCVPDVCEKYGPDVVLIQCLNHAKYCFRG